MAKKTDGWMPLYVADYLADTSRLTTEQHGAYMLLIMDYWRNGAPPDDDAVLAQICRLQPSQWRKHAPVLRGFFEQKDGKLAHKRIDAEREKASDISGKRTASAQQGAAKRWGKPMPNAMPNGMPNGIDLPEQNAWQNDAPSPYTNNQYLSDLKVLVVGDDQKPPDDPQSLGQQNATPANDSSLREHRDAMPPCPPMAEIVALYHDALPSLPRVRILDCAKRRKATVAFWRWVWTSKRADGKRRATTREEAMAWMGEYFERAGLNDFLMGRGPRSDAHQNWVCDFEFLVSEKGRKHVIEKTREAA